jgi:hypothetical protein
MHSIASLLLACCSLLATSTLHAQLIDSFDDADFTANPAWVGATENFVVSAEGVLLLNDVAPILTQSALTTALNLSNLNDIEWRFKVSQNFAGSDNNHSRIYLASSNNTLNYTGNATANTQGYYLKLGEAGSADVIKLYLDNGSTTALLASGTSLIASAFDLALKVTRDESGLWSVYADPAGGTNYTLECIVTDNNYTTANFFGLVCTYTSSNTDAFAFDDIYVGSVLFDTAPPTILQAVASNATTLQVTFNEPLDPLSLVSNTQFSITGGINPINAVIDSENPALVVLTFASAFAANTTLTLSATGLADTSGNEQSNATSDFVWSVATPVAYRDVVFNEVLADPTPVVGMPETEFIELYNRTDAAINLNGWVLTNTTTDKVLTPYLLPANEYVVLCNSTDAGNFSNALGIASFTALTNGGDSLTLKDSNGNIVDILEYSINWFDTSIKSEGGWSLEQINPDYPCGNNTGNWQESIAAAGGTPGLVNSVLDTSPDTTAPTIVQVFAPNASTIAIVFSEVIDTTSWSMSNVPMTPFNQILTTYWSADGLTLFCIAQSALENQTEYSFGINPIFDCFGNQLTPAPISILLGSSPGIGDLRINEIYADPDDSSSLPNAEWMEVRNTTDSFIQIEGTMLNGQALSGAPLAPQGFLIVTDESATTAFLGYTGRVVYLSSFPALTNSGMELSITNADGDQLDQVTYDITWYNDATKDDGGWSLELINATLPCSGPDNWSASISAAQGTPGASNSVASSAPDTQAPFIESITPIDAFHFTVTFSEIMEESSWSGISLDLLPFNSILSAQWNGAINALECETQFALNNEVEYSFILLGLTDCSGNALAETPYTFVLGVVPSAGSLLITEIMCDPSPSQGLPDAEYIELLNVSDQQLNLYGLTINGGFVDGSYILGPNETLLVTDIENELAFLFYEVPKLYVSSFDDLTNSGAKIEILDIAENVIHEVSYRLDWYNDPDKDDGGWSLEMINPNDPCSNQDNWRASMASNGGTPGTTNSVNDTEPDTTAPQLFMVYVPSDSQFILDFDEPIDASSLATSTITVNGGSPQNIDASIVSNDITMIQINTSQMEPGMIYTFELNGITDCWGNETNTIIGQYAAAQEAAPGDLIINEILYDPYEDGSKFIEIYNRSNKNIGLRNWQLNDLSGGDVSSPNTITTQGVLLFPGAYLVLTERASGITRYYSAARSTRLFEIDDLPDYTSEDMVLLLMPDSTISDQVAYNSDYHYPLLDDTKGISLERVDAERPSNDPTNWHSAASSVQFATPGYLNSQASAYEATELTFGVNPETFSPDNDGYNDQVDFSYQFESEGYTGSISIYDTEGRLIRSLMQNSLLGRTGSISWDGVNDDRQKAAIGIYIVYFEAFNTSGVTKTHKTTCVLAHPLN